MASSEESNLKTNERSVNDIFKKMIDADSKQNNKLANKYAFNFESRTKKLSSNHVTGMRFFVCTLGLFALTTSQMSRMVLNVTITSMVNPEMMTKSSQVSSDGSCPKPQDINQIQTSLSTTSTTLEPEVFTQDEKLTTTYLPQDLSTILDYYNSSTEASPEQISTETTTIGTNSEIEVDGYSETSDSNVSIKPDIETFDWSMRQQSVLLGGFYSSYFLFMIIGGRMAEVYGAKYVIFLSVAGSGIINLATPWMARTNFVMLVSSRVVLGAIQSGVFPGMYALFSKWLTTSEASIYAPLLKVSLRLGMMTGSFLPGLLPSWHVVFYTTGIVCTIWSVLWFFFATSEPKDCPWVSTAELEHIHKKKRKPTPDKSEEAKESLELKDYEKNNEKQVDQEDATNNKTPTKKTLKTPWLKIITSPSVIGLIIVKLTFGYAIDFMAILLPTYLHYVHHATRQQISSITTAMFLMQVLLVVFIGWLAKVMVKRRPCGLSKTGVRKSFQALASYGVGIFIILCSFNNCDLTLLAILIQIVSFLTMFTAGGETMLPYDLSDEYPASIMAIANSAGNMSSITTTSMAGYMLGDKPGSYDRWNKLIRLIGGANILGGFAFSVLVKAEPIDFSKSKKTIEDGHVNNQVIAKESETTTSISVVVINPEGPVSQTPDAEVESKTKIECENQKDPEEPSEKPI